MSQENLIPPQPHGQHIERQPFQPLGQQQQQQQMLPHGQNIQHQPFVPLGQQQQLGPNQVAPAEPADPNAAAPADPNAAPADPNAVAPDLEGQNLFAAGGMVFERVEIENIYFRHYLRDEFKDGRQVFPEDLRRARNFAIIISGFEFAFALLSSAQWALRRNRMIAVMTVLNIFFVGMGLLAKMSLNYCGLILHSTYMISIIGGFYIYIMINFLIKSQQEKHGRGYDDENNLNEVTIQLITSLPLLLLFLMGCYSLVLLLKVDEELEARRLEREERIANAPDGLDPLDPNFQAPEPLQIVDAPPPVIVEPNNIRDEHNQLQEALIASAANGRPGGELQGPGPAGQQPGANLNQQQFSAQVLKVDEERLQQQECIICMAAPRDTAMAPCGHKCMCWDCSQQFKQMAQHQVCPICRNRVRNYIKIYE